MTFDCQSIEKTIISEMNSRSKLLDGCKDRSALKYWPGDFEVKWVRQGCWPNQSPAPDRVDCDGCPIDGLRRPTTKSSQIPPSKSLGVKRKEKKER